MVVIRSAAPEQFSSHKAVQGGTWDCPAGGRSRAACHHEGCQVKPWGIAARNSCVMAGIWGWKGRQWEGCLAGQAAAAALQRLCEGCGPAAGCRHAAGISRQWRLPINPGSSTGLWVCRVTQGGIPLPHEMSPVVSYCKSPRRGARKATTGLEAAEVSLVQLLEQPPVGFSSCLGSKAAVKSCSLHRGPWPSCSPAWSCSWARARRSGERCPAPALGAPTSSACCERPLPSRKAETFTDILYYVSVALLFFFVIKAASEV